VPGLAPGTKANIDLGAGPVAATVVWVEKNAAGLQFAQPLRQIPSGFAEVDIAKAA
jgi:hypothetical protein